MKQDSKNIFVKLISIFSACLLWSSAASAAAITFDELDITRFNGDEPLSSLTNTYTSQGVSFDDGAYPVRRLDPASKTGNYLSGTGTTITFSGELPTYVSLIVSNVLEYVVFPNARGPNYIENKQITGILRGMTVEPSDITPYTPDQFIEFSSATGIASIGLTGQQGYELDDLTFFYAHETIPEPSTLLLLSVGMIGLAIIRRRARSA